MEKEIDIDISDVLRILKSSYVFWTLPNYCSLSLFFSMFFFCQNKHISFINYVLAI